MQRTASAGILTAMVTTPNGRMDSRAHSRTQALILARRQHPAWRLLAARRAPLILGCLDALFEYSRDGIDYADAEQSLADLLAEHAGLAEFDISGDPALLARRELRAWVRSGLIVEREGRIHATDALESALRFATSLGDHLMTSTASRLAVVQREIEHLEARLNPDPESRAEHLRQQIAALQAELAQAEAGNVDVAEPREAIEGIREIYTLATGLRADFRRVEDSWRAADLVLRHAIIDEGQHRGAIVDSLLDGHDALLQTNEGQVFDAFHQQLRQEVELDAMKRRLRSILRHPEARDALSVAQQADLGLLVIRLVQESATVIRARSRSEGDVRGFLRTGLAAEHHRVGQLLQDVFRAAQGVDWQRTAVRRQPASLPPVAIAPAGLPLIERLRVKSLDREARRELDLARAAGDLSELGEDFWWSLDNLDRAALVRDTLAVIRASTEALSLAALAQRLPPSHDLETLAVWIGMAREAGCAPGAGRETLDLDTRDGQPLRFDVPALAFAPEAFAAFDWEP